MSQAIYADTKDILNTIVKNPKTTASSNCKTLVECFLPIISKTINSRKLREKEWHKHVDTHKSGKITLEELQDWVSKKLLAKYGRGKGTTVYRYFTTVFKFAFGQARSSVGHHAMSNSADETIIPKEFRLTVAHIVVFAIMYDAFVQIYLASDKTKNSTKGMDDRSTSSKHSHTKLMDETSSSSKYSPSKMDDASTSSKYSQTKKSKSTPDRHQRRRPRDKQITLEQWLVAGGYKKVSRHGLVTFRKLEFDRDMEDAASLIAMDLFSDQTAGTMNFTEFCLYLKQAEIRADTTYGKLLRVGAREVVTPQKSPSPPRKSPPRKSPPRTGNVEENGEREQTEEELLEETIHSYQKAINGENNSENNEQENVLPDVAVPTTTRDIVGDGATENITKFVDVFLPMADRTPESRQVRNQVWALADMNQNNRLSLGDIERWVRKTLEQEMGMLEGKNVFRNYFPACIHAFRDAQTIHVLSSRQQLPHSSSGDLLQRAPSDEEKANDNNNDTDTAEDNNQYGDCITRSEFRLLIANMCAYSLMFDAYNQIDDGTGKGISLEDFLKDYELVANHGLVAFLHIQKVAGTGTHAQHLLAKHIFKQIDQSGGGLISFGEWFVYLKNAELKALTKMGQLIQSTGGPGDTFYSNKNSIVNFEL